MKYSEALPLLKFKKESKFILVGPEAFLKKRFVDLAIRLYPEHEVSKFFEDDENSALDVLGTESLFGAHLVILHDFEKLKVIHKDIEILKSFPGVLIIVCSEKMDLKSRAITELTSFFRVVECSKLRPYDLDYPLWIVSYVFESGFTLKDEADRYIYERVGPNMSAIAHELDKLFILKAEDKVITKEDVEKYVANVAVSTAYELLDSLLHRNVPAALKQFDSYMKMQDTFIELVAFLGSYLEKLYRILLLREEKLEANAIADILGIPKFLVKTKYLSVAYALGKDFLSARLNSLCSLDVDLRLFKGDKKILVERYLMEYVK